MTDLYNIESESEYVLSQYKFARKNMYDSNKLSNEYYIWVITM